MESQGCSCSLYGSREDRLEGIFCPLSKPNYEIVEIQRNSTAAKFGSRYTEVELVVPYTSSIKNMYPQVSIKFYKYKKTKNNNSIIITTIRSKNVAVVNTIVVSQSTKDTLGSSLGFLIDLCIQLKSDVISYDYSGFGRSEGVPSIEEAVDDLKEVISFAAKGLCIPTSSMIFFGLGLGTLPTLKIGSIFTGKKYKIQGLVIYNPFISAIQEFNIRIKKITWPVFLIKSMEKKEIEMNEVNQFSKNFSSLDGWYPKVKKELETYIVKRNKFLKKLKDFITYLDVNLRNEMQLINSFNVDGFSRMNIEDSYLSKKGKNSCSNSSNLVIVENASTSEDTAGMNNNLFGRISEDTNNNVSNRYTIVRKTLGFKIDFNADSTLKEDNSKNQNSISNFSERK